MDYKSVLPLIFGFAAYGSIRFFLKRPLRTYVFGHELTHALAAVLTGARIYRFRAGPSSGHVSLSKSNLFIALAPYFIPLYAVMILGGWGLANLWKDFSVVRPGVVLAIGASLAFHLDLTAFSIRQNQPDLRYAGTFFSLVVIALTNILVLVLFLKGLFPHRISIRYFIFETFERSIDILLGMWEMTQQAIALWPR